MTVKKYNSVLALSIIAIFFTKNTFAVKITDLSESKALELALKFFSFNDKTVIISLIGAVSLGICSGIIGSFLVVRKLSLLGDTLSHAILPGIAIGFLITKKQNPIIIFISALIFGFIAYIFVQKIKNTTKLKNDVALGMTLSGFFAIGIAIITYIQNLKIDKSGLNNIFFGQISSISNNDLILIISITTIIILSATILYRPLLLFSFDKNFANSSGIPINSINIIFMLLLVASIIISLKAVGLVLVTAMLITPPSTAYLISKKFHKMIIISVFFSVISAIVGCFLSTIFTIPTGSAMALTASSIFFITFLINPKKGIISKKIASSKQKQKINLENSLKTLYKYNEDKKNITKSSTIEKFAIIRNIDIKKASKDITQLQKNKLIYPKTINLTPKGLEKAKKIVRNHRLWELYLANKANFKTDHVHEEAEKIEHIIPENLIKDLDKSLNHPKKDPHGKKIPK